MLKSRSTKCQRRRPYGLGIRIYWHRNTYEGSSDHNALVIARICINSKMFPKEPLSPLACGKERRHVMESWHWIECQSEMLRSHLDRLYTGTPATTLTITSTPSPSHRSVYYWRVCVFSLELCPLCNPMDCILYLEFREEFWNACHSTSGTFPALGDWSCVIMSPAFKPGFFTISCLGSLEGFAGMQTMSGRFRHKDESFESYVNHLSHMQIPFDILYSPFREICNIRSSLPLSLVGKWSQYWHFKSRSFYSLSSFRP